MTLWLHSQGYNYFNLPRLTYPEIKGLVDARNRQVKHQKAEQDKMARKNKNRSNRR